MLQVLDEYMTVEYLGPQSKSLTHVSTSNARRPEALYINLKS